jgi:hypothetical protein
MAEEKKKPGRPKKFAGRPPKSGLIEAEKLPADVVAVEKSKGVSTPRADRYADCGGFVWMTIHHNHAVQVIDMSGKQPDVVWVPIIAGDKVDMKIQVGKRVCVPRAVAIVLDAANDVDHPGYDQELAMREMKEHGVGMGNIKVKKIRWPYTIEREATAEEFEEFASGKKAK